jgi:hypothetical protein
LLFYLHCSVYNNGQNSKPPHLTGHPNLPAIIEHGKAYPLIHTKLRSNLAEGTLDDLIYIFSNTKLTAGTDSNLVSFDDFALGLLDERECETLRATLPSLSTMNRIGPAADYAPTAEDSSEDGGGKDGDGEDSSLDGESGGSSGSSSSPEIDSSDEMGGEDTDAEMDEEDSSILTVTPDGFSAVTQVPSEPLPPTCVGQEIMAMVKLPKQPMDWCFGKLVRHFDKSKDKKFASLYNFDVLFNGQKGAVGMMLEVSGTTTAYITPTGNIRSPEGTWFFVTRSTP